MPRRVQKERGEEARAGRPCWLICLKDPRTQGVAWIGTSSRLEEFYITLMSSKLPRRGRWTTLRTWLTQLHDAKLQPDLEVLKEYGSAADARRAKARLVAQLRGEGRYLLNPPADMEFVHQLGRGEPLTQATAAERLEIPTLEQ